MNRYTLFVDGNKEDESNSLQEIFKQRKIFLSIDNWELAKEVKPYWPWEKQKFLVKEVWVTPDYSKSMTIVIVDNNPKVD